MKIDNSMDDTKKLNDIWTSRWYDRFSKDEFAYAEEPTNYLKELKSRTTEQSSTDRQKL
jgi:hypothetical protein